MAFAKLSVWKGANFAGGGRARGGLLWLLPNPRHRHTKNRGITQRLEGSRFKLLRDQYRDHAENRDTI